MASQGLSLEVDGLMETLKAVRGISDALERKETNSQLRDAADRCARGLVVELQRAAASSGVPVAPRVSQSIRVKRDRIPVVSVGGSFRVGRNGAPASALVWGSEQGPKGSVNHWGVPASAGYWIAPATERFGRGPAIDLYRRAVFEILNEAGLV